MAIRGRSLAPLSISTSDVAMVAPAEGPFFSASHEGKCTSTVMLLASRPIQAAMSLFLALTHANATAADSRIEAPTFPVMISSPVPGEVTSVCTANASPPSPDRAAPTPMGKPPKHPPRGQRFK
eukprot:25624-Eustigmatos_ZCMA.PRE.1